VVGFDLFELEEDTGLVLADLEPAVRNRVRGGITADDPDDADRILDRLRAEQLPLCPLPEDTTPSAGASTSAPAATPSRTAPTAGTSARPPATGTAGAPAATSPGAPAATSAGPAPLTTAAPRTSATPATTTPTRTTPSSEPGVSCREAN
jgi:protein phosphatase